MVVGTGSSAGKSLMVTALCRIFKNHGLTVAPFKSQNMSLNSFVTPEGHEMGRAQVSQAEAAGLTPSALMNPILLKPTTNRKSQVIVNGKVHGTMGADEYYAYKHNLLPQVKESFQALASQYQVVVIEGAGSPAEINLMEGDFVNMGLAEMLGTPAILVGDIDRGGVFASIYGTVKLLPPAQQALVKGFLINKFRGDEKILEPGLRQIEELLDIPVLGVIPYEKFALDEEDSLTDRLSYQHSSSESILNIAVIRLPRLSNFTDFAVFDQIPGLTLNYVDSPQELKGADLIIIPGSKNTIEDMRYLESRGLASEIKSFAKAGHPVVGICGGFQMLGRSIYDPAGVESSLQSIDGLGLLNISTVMAEVKQTTQATLPLADLGGILAGTCGLVLEGYEIHMGKTNFNDGVSPLADEEVCQAMGAASLDGQIFGSYLHGFFDNLEFTCKFLNNLAAAKGLSHTFDGKLQASTYQELKEKEYDRLAALVEEHLPFETLAKIVGL